MKPPHACRFLQNKAWLFPPPAGEESREIATFATPFTCLRTHEPVGPDGRDVGERVCRADRPCFRPEVDL